MQGNENQIVKIEVEKGNAENQKKRVAAYQEALALAKSKGVEK